MLYKVVLTFESVEDILKCDYLNGKLLSRTVSRGNVYHAVKGDSNFLSLWRKSSSVTTEIKSTEQYFVIVVPMFQSLDENLYCDHSN